MQDLIQKIPDIRKMREGQWMARCPAHDDKDHSLSVRAGDTAWMLHCFAGCELRSVVDALGLGMKDLFYHQDSGKISDGRKFHTQKEISYHKTIVDIAEHDMASGAKLSNHDYQTYRASKKFLLNHKVR